MNPPVFWYLSPAHFLIKTLKPKTMDEEGWSFTNFKANLSSASSSKLPTIPELREENGEAEAYQLLADAAEQRGDVDAAIAYTEKTAGQQQPRLNQRLADLYLKKGDTDRAVAYCPHCGLNVTTQLCPGCSSEVAPGWKFCVTCGRAIGARSP